MLFFYRLGIVILIIGYSVTTQAITKMVVMVSAKEEGALHKAFTQKCLKKLKEAFPDLLYVSMAQSVQSPLIQESNRLQPLHLYFYRRWYVADDLVTHVQLRRNFLQALDITAGIRQNCCWATPPIRNERSLLSPAKVCMQENMHSVLGSLLLSGHNVEQDTEEPDSWCSYLFSYLCCCSSPKGMDKYFRDIPVESSCCIQSCTASLICIDNTAPRNTPLDLIDAVRMAYDLARYSYIPADFAHSPQHYYDYGIKNVLVVFKEPPDSELAQQLKACKKPDIRFINYSHFDASIDKIDSVRQLVEQLDLCG
ncbi:hypothetical protein CI610_00836 [invertebrate metagenome]|uniref:Uncharacterized protein n=1 Tax=invertebrate metagenome TaxID=1711999 RepID=A0A2H9TAG2_9ZZZZ